MVWLAGLVCVSAALVAADAQSALPVREGYELSLSRPTAEQMVMPDLVSADGQTFVQIEVSEVDNPKRLPLSLSVHAETDDRGAIYLGSVNLSPSTGEEKFLIATQGTLQGGGKIKVTLLPLQDPGSNRAIRVRLKRFEFLKR